MKKLGIKRKASLASKRLVLPILHFAAKRKIFFSENDRRLWELKDRHKGERAVVIGMGPSLQQSDLELFAGFVSFACNKIYLAYSETDWRPSYYSVIDVVVADNNQEEISELSGSTKIFPSHLKSHLEGVDDGIFFTYSKRMRDFKDSPRFSFDPLSGMFSGGATVILSQIQLALWMGVKEIYVVGVDFSFEVSPETETKSKHGEVVLRSEGEQNHFHKDYRKPGEKWTAPRMEEQEFGFKYAAAACQKAGVKLVNASRVSKLKELPREDFVEVFSSARESS